MGAYKETRVRPDHSLHKPLATNYLTPAARQRTPTRAHSSTWSYHRHHHYPVDSPLPFTTKHSQAACSISQHFPSEAIPIPQMALEDSRSDLDGGPRRQLLFLSSEAAWSTNGLDS
ncbi:hypothetical protein BC827DRAFT_527786 [Russula dissimulans]|nr:hypothetical protein BC827DRAFT_527786 [Russula dissimulans]